MLTGQEITKENQSDIKQNLRFFNVFLLVFAGVAVFVGMFIIYNTFSILVAQRGRELALLRAIGASRRQVLTSVLVEGLAVGLIASIVGLGLGILVAIGLTRLLDALGFDLPSGSLVVLPRTVLVSLIVGVTVTVVSAFFPARRGVAHPARRSDARRRHRHVGLVPQASRLRPDRPRARRVPPCWRQASPRAADRAPARWA